jgi:hypothetical protein
MQTHRYLAVGDLAQSAAVLPCHAHRVPPGLRKRGLVEDPDFRFTEKVHDFMRQALLDFGHGPGTLAHKLPQGLHVGTFDAAGQGLDRLALAIQQQALDVDPRPVPALAPPHRFGEVFEKLLQAMIQSFQFFGRHAPTVAGAS